MNNPAMLKPKKGSLGLGFFRVTTNKTQNFLVFLRGVKQLFIAYSVPITPQL
jgi:hypothetical protein